MNDTDKLAYTVEEAMSAIGIGRTFLYQLAAQRRLDLRKVGGRTLITAASLRRLIEDAPDAPLHKRRPISKTLAPDVLALVNEGLSYSEISERLGISRATCCKIARNAGIIRGQNHKRTEWTDETHSILVGMSKAGLSSVIIAKRLGISRQSVTKERRRLGISMKGRPLVRSDGRRIRVV